jgi:hypothetical protein
MTRGCTSRSTRSVAQVRHRQTLQHHGTDRHLQVQLLPEPQHVRRLRVGVVIDPVERLRPGRQEPPTKNVQVPVTEARSAACQAQ